MNSGDLRLYAVSACGAPVEYLAAAESGGATMVQLREKELDNAAFTEKALQARRALHSVPLIINDNPEVAARCGADGVHIGQSDAALADARAAMGKRIIGVSASTLAEAVAAEAGGADYLGLGAVFPTDTKNDASAVTFSCLKSICATVKIPVVAIGGIHSGNVLSLGGSGVSGVAVISELFSDGSEIAEKTAAFSKLTREMLKSGLRRDTGAIVDLDGVLLDSLEVWHRLDCDYLRSRGCLTDANLAVLHNCGTLRQAACAVRNFGVTEPEEMIIREFRRRLYDEYAFRLQLLPGAENFLRSAVRSGCKLALVTSTPLELVRPALNRLNISGCFNVLLGDADKHRADIMLHAAECLGCGIGDCTVYDDTRYVRETAAAAGFKVKSGIN